MNATNMTIDNFSYPKCAKNPPPIINMVSPSSNVPISKAPYPYVLTINSRNITLI